MNRPHISLMTGPAHIDEIINQLRSAQCRHCKTVTKGRTSGVQRTSQI